MIRWHQPRAAMLAAARDEYARRHAAWQKMADEAPGRDESRRVADKGNADLWRWAEIIRWLDEEREPADFAPLARRAQATVEAIGRTGIADADRERFLWLARLARALDDAARAAAAVAARRQPLNERTAA